MFVDADKRMMAGTAEMFRELGVRDVVTAEFLSGKQVSKEEYVKITYDYAVTAAQAMLNANPAIGFIFLSGAGADWYRNYKSQYPNDRVEDFAPFGYEAGKVDLTAIDKADKKDREAIRAAVAATSSADFSGSFCCSSW